jgi:uncharacterized protein (DUF2236 family)
MGRGSTFPAEAEIERLLVGEESVTWQFVSDVRLQLVMLYPLLLQVAHPTVAAGVRDHSDFEQRPWDRLLRTIDYVSLLVYGGDRAPAAGRRLRELHKSFRGVREDGKRYSALEPRAYAWVHATLIATYVEGHRHFGRPMSPDQVERFYREYRGLGRLIGVRDSDLPSDWAGFRAYFDSVLATELARSDSTDRVLRAVRARTPAPPGMSGSVWLVAQIPTARAIWVGSIGLMTPALRGRLGIRWTPLDEVAFRGLGLMTRSCEPMLPERYKVTGPAHLRWRRDEIAGGPLGEAEATMAR